MFNDIGFIGLGLIGGSIARKIRSVCPGVRLSAFDINGTSTRQALEDGVLDSAVNTFDAGFFSGCDLILICTPVLCVEAFLPGIKEIIGKEAVLSDVGSVKGEIFSLIEKYGLGPYFIGGHPMAGTEKSGYANSFASLTEGANYILCPSKDAPAQKLEAMKEFVGVLGSNVLVLEPARHDLAAAAISHLPHILAYSLANLIDDGDDSDGAFKLMAAGGLKDMIRIASSSPDMWEQICLSNRDNILRLLDVYTGALDEVRRELEAGDGAALHSRFAKAKAYRDTFN